MLHPLPALVSRVQHMASTGLAASCLGALQPPFSRHFCTGRCERRAWPRVKARLVGLLGRVGLVGGLQVDLEGLPVALDRHRQAIVAAQVQVQRTLRIGTMPSSGLVSVTNIETFPQAHAGALPAQKMALTRQRSKINVPKLQQSCDLSAEVFGSS